MPGFLDSADTPADEEEKKEVSLELGFVIPSQKLELDFDFTSRSLKGKTEILIEPKKKDLKVIRLNCKQCIVKNVTVQGKRSSYSYDDSYERLQLHPDTGLRQYHVLHKRVEQLNKGEQQELIIDIPDKVRIEPVDPFSVGAQDALLSRTNNIKGEAVDVAGPLDTPMARTAVGDDEETYAPLKVCIDFEMREPRDGLHFAGVVDGDSKYPHVYTRNSYFPGTASCVFPCVDLPSLRSNWEISIRYPRTLGDVFRKSRQSQTNGVNGHSAQNGALSNGAVNGVSKDVDMMILDGDDNTSSFTEEEKALDMSVVCSGDMTDDIIDPADSTRKTSSFVVEQPVAAQHIGFAIGPFEHVDLSEFRESDQDEKMGQSAVRIHAFCLPGRADEVRNTCMGLTQGIDHFTIYYGSYPYTSYKLAFVDDLVPDVAHAASLSICSTRLLFPEDILDPLEPVTRTLMHGLASQWIGVNVMPKVPDDWWLIIGGAYFMADQAMLLLCGKNDYRFRQKMGANELFERDRHRASIATLGRHLHLHPGEMEFMALKAPLILFILHQRMVKTTGRNGIPRCLFKVFLTAKTGELSNGELSTAWFLRTCEKVAHMKLNDFFDQWVHGAGCPEFQIEVKFNKKNASVDVTLTQVQYQSLQRTEDHFLNSKNFMQEVREHNAEVWAEQLQEKFTVSATHPLFPRSYSNFLGSDDHQGS